MPLLSCCRSFGTTFALLSRAAAKSAAAKLRAAGALPVRVDWARRATLCERCPMRVVRGGVSYCGSPFLDHVHRTPHLDGCGCPTRDKAKSPDEHCPITPAHGAAASSPTNCDCKWCAAAA